MKYEISEMWYVLNLCWDPLLYIFIVATNILTVVVLSISCYAYFVVNLIFRSCRWTDHNGGFSKSLGGCFTMAGFLYDTDDGKPNLNTVKLCNNYQCTCCLHSAGRNDFDTGNIHYKCHWKGVGPENRDFFGPWNGNERSECHLALILSPVQFYIQNYLLGIDLMDFFIHFDVAQHSKRGSSFLSKRVPSTCRCASRAGCGTASTSPSSPFWRRRRSPLWWPGWPAHLSRRTGPSLPRGTGSRYHTAYPVLGIRDILVRIRTSD